MSSIRSSCEDGTGHMPNSAHPFTPEACDMASPSAERLAPSRSRSRSRSPEMAAAGDAPEPKFKYERLNSDLRGLLNADTATCICVHPKLVVVGTMLGKLQLMDAIGSRLSNQAGFNSCRLESKVVQVSIDHLGEFVACATLDGKVAIRGLFAGEHNLDINTGKQIRALALDPLYYQSGSGRRFMTGDDNNVVIHEKTTMFNRYRQRVLSSGHGDGPIGSIKWRGRWVAWTNRRGVWVYDVVESVDVGFIRAEPDETHILGERVEEVPYRIAWSDQFHLFIALGDAIKLCHIKPRLNVAAASPSTAIARPASHIVEVTVQFRLPDRYVAGIAPHKDNTFMVLSVPKNSEVDEQRPLVHLLRPCSLRDNKLGYAEIAADSLTMCHHEELKAKDYQLESLYEDEVYYIMSPKDIIVGKPRDEDDHIDWLLEQGQFAEALSLVEGSSSFHSLRRHTKVSVGLLYIDSLLQSGSHAKEAADLCKDLLGRDLVLWKQVTVKFIAKNQLRSLASHFPTGDGSEDWEMEPAFYEMALFEFVKRDTKGLLEMVRSWHPSRYRTEPIIKAVMEELLLYPGHEHLQRSLATLYGHQGKFDKAMAVYLMLQHKDVFQLIREHKLYDSCRASIHELLNLDMEEGVNLLLDLRNHLPPQQIVVTLSAGGKSDLKLHRYLDALVSLDWDASKAFHNLVVQFYATYAPDKLLPFLKKSDHYKIQEALDIADRHGLIQEKIFILARMGNNKEALNLINNELCDIHEAVRFCKEQDDLELWHALIDYTLDKPYYINVLLNHIGTHVDPRMLIEKIQAGQEIPGLRNSLVQIIQDYCIQVSLIENTLRILNTDLVGLKTIDVSLRAKGLRVEENFSECAICGLAFLDPESDGRPAVPDESHFSHKDLIQFNCKHIFHAECLGEGRTFCVICHKN